MTGLEYGPAARRVLAAAALAALLVADAAADGGRHDAKPRFVRGDVIRTAYDGVSDDLLTAGLGKSGLAGTAPSVSVPPTAAELRRLAIYNNYRALVDMTAGGGYGTLYGPNVLADGTVTAGEGRIAGIEYLAYASDGRGRENVTMMVQIPASFDPQSPCIVTGASSGSRGVYGAIGTSGEWGLKNGCAVAYTDKGSGNGAHSLARDTVNLIQGQRVDADAAGRDSAFTAPIPDREREAFNAERPDRYAFKHAHSRLNPEADWGRDVLRAVEFAFWVLNKEFGGAAGNGEHDDDDDGRDRREDDDDDDDDDRDEGRKHAGRRAITPGNTIVIGSSVSNGAGAALLAAEQDRKGLIDGIAVSEPNVNPRFDSGFVIEQAGRDPVANHSRSLFDYTSLLALYQGCANAANPTAPLNLTDALFAGPLGTILSANRCQSLFETGLLSAPDPAEAQKVINDYGILVEQNVVQPSHYWVSVPQAIVVTYGSAYSRARVQDALCGFTLGATSGNPLGTVPGTGEPVPLPAASEAVLFGVGNGIPPTGGINVIYDEAAGGPILDRRGVSPSTGRADESFDGVACLRALQEGRNPATGERLRGRDRAAHRRLMKSVREIRASGDLDGIPAVIVTGRADAIIPPNHASRAYYGLNQRVEGSDSRLRYYEITNAQHLDAFNAFAGFDNRFVPLHHYFNRALDLMFAHLKGDLASLPPSQVVETIPRGGAPGAAPMIVEATNLPPIAAAPAKPIVFTGSALQIP